MARRTARSVLALGLLTLAVSGCAGRPRVLLPPHVDLAHYHTVGIVIFTSNATGALPDYVTQRFMESVQAAQPAVRFLELGSEAEVLRAIGRSRLDFEAVQAAGKKWGVDALFSGKLDVTQVKPRVSLERLVESLSLAADVDATLHSKLVETAAGTTVWTRTAAGSAPVASVKLVAKGPIDFGARDPERAYGSLARCLVDDVAVDFRSRWVRQ